METPKKGAQPKSGTFFRCFHGGGIISWQEGKLRRPDRLT